MMISEQKIGVLAEQISLLTDPSIGLIESIDDLPIRPGGPRLHHFIATACHSAPFGVIGNSRIGGGVSTQREVALAKAVGEALERYSSAIFDPLEFPLTSARKARFACVAPSSFALYDVSQYASGNIPLQPLTDDAPVRWTGGINLATGKEIHVPAGFVWLPYYFDREAGETPICQPISTGLACHRTRNEAIRTGLEEVVERDCFTLFWLAKTCPPHIDKASLNEETHELMGRLEQAGYDVILLDLSVDNRIPCILAVLKARHPDLPSHVFAASASLDADNAVWKALEEAAHTERLSGMLYEQLPPLLPHEDGSNISERHSHVRVACAWQNRHIFEPYLSSPHTRDLPRQDSVPKSAQAHVDELVRRIVLTGHDVISIDITSPDLLELGLHVYRSIIPGYHPLSLGHSLRCLGGRRLYQVPQKLGFRGIASAEQAQIMPHPFP